MRVVMRVGRPFAELWSVWRPGRQSHPVVRHHYDHDQRPAQASSSTAQGGDAAQPAAVPTPDDSPIGGADAAEVALNGRVMSRVRFGGQSDPSMGTERVTSIRPC